ncbi:MAG: hypothetical protein ABIQ31_05475 [Ferruginibacter sp.]
MKKIFYLPIILIFLCTACKKEGNIPLPARPVPQGYIKAIQVYLRLHASGTDYNSFDFQHYRLSKQNKFWYFRVALSYKPLATDFVLVKTDSLGNAMDGRIIHIVRTAKDSAAIGQRKNTGDNYYTGAIDISALNRNTTLHSAITNGFIELFHQEMFKNNTRESSLPYPYDDLPEVIVVGYRNVANEGSNFSFADYMMLQNLFNTGTSSGGGSPSGDYSGSTTGGSSDPVIYVYSGGYTPNSNDYTSGNNTTPTENTVPNDLPDIAVSPDNSFLRPQVDIEAWMKCFTDIPDQGATCSITLLGDLPVNTNPGIGLNIWSGNTGHCFLQLTKTNGTQSVTQIIGFTAENPFQAIVNTDAFVAGKTVDNAGHKYNCSITMDLTSYGFNTVIDKMKTLSSSMPYSVVNYDCLDYGLEVFNSVRPANPLVIPKVYGVNDPFSNIATGPKLYTLLDNMVSNGSSEAANIFISGPVYAGLSHGPCN